MANVMVPVVPLDSSTPRMSYSTPCRLPRVEGSVPKDVRLKILRVKKRNQADKNKAISIDEVPMMLLPKARIRTNLDILNPSKDLVIPDADFSSLHLSTLHPDADFIRLKAMSRSSSFRSRSRPLSRSDADSGIGSMKRCVTFDDLNISRSTVFKSQEELDAMSEISGTEEENKELHQKEDEEDSLYSSAPAPTLNSSLNEADMPEFVDSFGDANSYFETRPQSKMKRNRFLDSWRSRRSRSVTPFLANIEPCHEYTCSICKEFMSDKERIQKTFGGVESFLQWIYSRWGKRKELRNLPRTHYVFRGRQPRFCNIVQQVQLHEKETKSPTSHFPEDDSQYDDVDYLQRSIDEGRLIGSRKHSDARIYKEHLTNYKTQETGDSMNNHGKQGRLLSNRHEIVEIPCTIEEVNETPKPIDHPKEMEQEPVAEKVKDDGADVIPEQIEPGQNNVMKPPGTEARPSSPSSVVEESTKINVKISGLDKPEKPKSTKPVRVPSVVEVKPRPLQESKFGNYKYKKPRNLALDIRIASDENAETWVSQLKEDSEISGSEVKDVDISTLVGEKSKEDDKLDSPELYIPSGDSDQDGSKQDVEPTQPPPTPEILTPKETLIEEKSTPKKGRSCINKKTKQPVHRVRKQKEKMEEKEEEVKPPTPPPQTPPLPEVKEEKDIEVNIGIPDLPTYKEKEGHKYKEKRKEKHALIIPKNVTPKEELEDLLDVPLATKIKEFDWTGMDVQTAEESPRKSQKADWVTGRLALSQQSSRFELPMDMRVLETMSPQEYLRKYCKITKRRQKLYNDVFRRFQKIKDRVTFIPYTSLEKALMSVLVSTLSSEHFSDMCQLIAINSETEVDLELFSALAALEERLLYKDFVTPETLGMPDYKKEKVECADFSALEWKFQGIQVNPPVYKLLKQLADDTK